jgi:hypothetical protein
MFDQILAQLQADFAKSNITVAARSANAVVGSSIPPVLQLNTLPAPIDLSQYKNPFGPNNPNGNYISLFQFSKLSNDVPSFTKFYAPSGLQLPGTYQSVVNGAVVAPGSTFASAEFAKAMAVLNQAKLAGLDGSGESWWPAYASPSNWYDLVTEDQNLFETEIDLTQPQTAFSSHFSIISDNTPDKLTWNLLPSIGRQIRTALSANTTVNTIRLKFMQVQVSRPWFDMQLLKMNGWSLPGQQPGFVSSGSLTENEGVIPLYTTSFIIGTDLEIVASLDSADSHLVAERISADGIINLGPFAIDTYRQDQPNNDVLTNSGYFVMAWISQLVGFSAQLA